MPRTHAMPLSLGVDRRQLLLALGAMASLLAIRPLRAQESRTVEHALGKTAILTKPQRVLVLSDFTDLEYTLALGITPIGYGFTGAWDRGGLPWQDVANLEQVPLVDGVPSPEVVARLEPDLIIGMKSYIESVQTQLEGVAPVIALDWSMPWRDGLRIVGQALFEDERAEAAIAATEALMASTAADLAGLGGRAIMIGSLYSDTLYVIGAGPIAEQLAELGLTFIPAPSAGDSGLAEYSMENVDILADADILLSFASDPEATARLEAFAPFQRLPAVAGHAYVPLDTIMGSAFADNFSPLSAKWVLPRLAELLKKAAAGEA